MDVYRRICTSDTVCICAADAADNYFMLEGSENYEAELDFAVVSRAICEEIR